MAKYIQGKDGKFAGSIGDGKTAVPTAAPQQWMSKKCDNCGAFTKDWTPRRWESTGDTETYCAACIADEQTISQNHDIRIAEQRFNARQSKWTDSEAIAKDIWTEEYTSETGEGEEWHEYGVVEIGVDGAPTIPYEILSGEVTEDPMGYDTRNSGWAARICWIEPKSDYEMTSLSMSYSGKYSNHSALVGEFNTKEEAVQFVKEQIASRMPREIAFLQAGKTVPAGSVERAASNGYQLTLDRTSRLSDGGAPVVSFRSKPTTAGSTELARGGHITALIDGRYRSVVRWEDGSRTRPTVGYFDTPQEAYNWTADLLSQAPQPGFGES